MEDRVRVKDLLSGMTPAEETAQMIYVCREKATKLVDAPGNFDFKKAKRAFKEGWEIGRVRRPSEAGSNPETPTDVRNARQMAELTNAIQKFSPEHSRLRIPVIFHEECADGSRRQSWNKFFAANWAGAKFNLEPGGFEIMVGSFSRDTDLQKQIPTVTK